MRTESQAKGRFMGAYMYQAAANVAIGTSTTVQAQLDTISYDSHGFCDPSINNWQFLIPPGMGGWYRFNAEVNITPDPFNAGYGARWLAIQMNGGSTIINQIQEAPPQGAAEWCEILSAPYRLAPGDFVKLFTWQNSGYGLNIRGGWREFTWMSMELIGR